MTVAAAVPDRHYFAGRGGKDIVPLYRDAEATQPNLHPELLGKLSAAYQTVVTPEDFAAYLYGLLAQPAFTARFAKELANCEVRVPLTADAALFQQVTAIGRTLLYLHTYGERFQSGQSWPQNVTKCLKAVPSNSLPEACRYDEAAKIIHVGSGQFGPVDKAIWDYEVSGLKVVQSWLGYRLANRKGKKSSPLDDITPAGWTSEFTSELLQLLNLLNQTVAIHPQQAELLEAVMAGPLLKADDFSPVLPQFRDAPKNSAAQSALGL
jgi:predicted helicase